MRRGTRGVEEKVLGLLVALPFLLGAAVVGSGEEPHRVVARLSDPEIVEASGLVAAKGLLVTVNDSGDAGRTFVVDGAGRTVGHTTWGPAVDDEALAPIERDVLVGDIGDNDTSRETISLLRVPVRRGEVAVDPAGAVRLVYPDGAHDAEALLVDPVSGTVLVATKAIFAGTLYRVPDAAVPPSVGAPAPLEPVRLEPIGAVPGLVTDGAFFPDGRHLVLRDYDRAVVYSWPDLVHVGEVDLPSQPQGEAIAVDEVDGRYRVLVGSEGSDSRVLEVRLPQLLAEAVAPVSASASGTAVNGASPGASSGASSSAGPVPIDGDQVEPTRPLLPFLLGAGLMVLVVVFLLRSLRPR